MGQSHQKWKWEVNSQLLILKGPRNKVYNIKGSKGESLQNTNSPTGTFHEVADVTMDVHCKPKIICQEYKETIEKSISINSTKCYIYWGHIEYIMSEIDLLTAISNQNCILATDGSNKYDEGAMVWCIANKEGQIIVRGRDRVLCAKIDASLLRSELVAILGSVTFWI